MSDRRPMRDELAEAERRFAHAEPPPAMDARVAAALAGERRPTLWQWAWIPVAAAVAVAAVLILSRSEDPCATLDGVAGPLGCRIEAAGYVAHVDQGPDARVRAVPEGFEVLDGIVTFRVEHRPDRAPLRVRVPGGVIDVIGTRFTVRTADGQGEVALHEGTIDFTRPDGRRVRPRPGESIEWGREALPTAPVDPPIDPAPATELPAPSPPSAPGTRAPSTETPTRVAAPTTAKRPARPRRRAPMTAPAPSPRSVSPPSTKAPSLDAALVDAARLRRAGQARAAVRVLTRALRRAPASPLAERASLELGALLAQELGDSARACAHWARHLARYPTGRSAPTVRARVRACP